MLEEKHMLKNNFKSSKQARIGAGEKLKLDSFPNTTGRPTGQGFGAARLGPSVDKVIPSGFKSTGKKVVKLNRGGMAKQKYNVGGSVGMPARMRNR
jgi:hypothetical protein